MKCVEHSSCLDYGLRLYFESKKMLLKVSILEPLNNYFQQERRLQVIQTD